MQLFPHQISAVEFLKDKKRYLLGDEPGLGKSAVALHVAREKQAKHILILCPKSLILNWCNEIKQWDVAHEVTTPTQHYYGTYGPLRHYWVFNWDSLLVERHQSLFLNEQWDFIIADESHLGIKNWKAKRCKFFVLELAKQAKSILLMTGTPITRSASDLHPTLSLLEPGKWGKFSQFCETFCEKVPNRFTPRGFDYRGFKNEVTLNKRLNNVMLRRYKEEVIKDLPDKRYKQIPVTVDAKLMADVLEADVQQIKHLIDTGSVPDAELATFLRSLGLAKVPAAIEYISTLGVPTVVFATHKQVIAELKAGLEKEELRVGVITGDTSAEERQKVVEDFQSGAIDIFIGNYVAAGTGITLTRSSDCVLVEFPWAFSTLTQAEDRIHRIGQKNAVLIHQLVAANSLDALVLSSLMEKRIGMKDIVGER